ncbi:MAG TPA: AsmA-like C-terminal region-containing protein [Candidatus Sulfotelmatobacter sp.]|nr:AsmA-like C-terminal region-containing protein [Candidatus Sulfotelmatobacter sp.]
MSSPATTSTPRAVPKWEGRPLRRVGRKTVILLASAAVVICGAAVFYVKFWPFSREAVLQDLKEASDSTVTARSYHLTYFPPGCVLDGVEFRHGSNQFRLIEIQKLVVEGSYIGILRKHVPRVVAFGAQVFVPPLGTKETFNTQHSDTVVDELVVHSSFVEFEAKEPKREPLRFDVHEAVFRDVRWNTALSYHLKFRNPNPPGEISADGKFGPWATGHPEDTPFSGDYTFEHADLSLYDGVSGLLSSKGKFEGALHHINVSGATDTPDFKVKSSNNKFHLTTKFEAYVNGRNGDTFLNSVEAHFGRTTVLARGSIAKVQGQKGKFAKIELSSRHGRIEDILGLFTAERSPMAGVTALKATAEIPSDGESFLHRLKMEGSFGVDDGSFTKPETQKNVDELSAGARGQNKEDPATVLSDLKGRVSLVEGTAHFSNLSFGIPGAEAQMHGTYSILEPHRINLHGQMRVDTKIFKTTSGMKSFLLKVMDPIFKKKKKGEIVPVHVLGTYEKPDFGLDLGNPEAAGK